MARSKPSGPNHPRSSLHSTLKTNPDAPQTTAATAEPSPFAFTPPPATGQPLTLRSILPFVLLGCLFWALYFSIGSPLEKRSLFRNDLFFNSDTSRIARDMGVFDAVHRRSNIHPLFILFVTPAGSALAHLTGSSTKGALIVNTFAGGLSIAVAGLFFVSLGLPLRRAVLFTLILGCSAAHLFFGSFPETFSFSALSIMLLMWLILRRPARFFPFLMAGVFSFGVLVTNLGFAMLAYAISFIPVRLNLRTSFPILLRLYLFPLCLIGVAAALAALQLYIWPTTRPFYWVKTFEYEKRFMDPLSTVGAVANRELLLSRHLLAYDWFAPNLRWLEARKVVMQTGSLATIQGWGMAGLVIWSALLILSAYLLIRHRLYRRALPLGLLLCLLYNIGLHTKYGDDLFLYSCNTCFLILALVALCTNELRLNTRRALAFDFALLLLFGCEVMNNHLFVLRLWSIYTQPALF